MLLSHYFKRAAAWLIAASLWAPIVASAIDLADQPLFSTTTVPGNMLLSLSVEYPTANTPAYLSTAAYASATTYLGYFDPEKCYQYSFNTTTPADSYFIPYGAATSHACTTTATVALWSGNYLNWSSTQTLDAFRWALTGGPRKVDTETLTVLQKTYQSGQGGAGLYPDKTLSAGVNAATPFNAGVLTSQVYNLGYAMYFSGGLGLSCSFSTDGNRKTTASCTTPRATTAVSCSTANNSPAIGGSVNCTAAQTVPSAATLTCTIGRATTNAYTYSCQSSMASTAACSAAANFGTTASATCSPAVVNYSDQSSASTTSVADQSSLYKVWVQVKACDSTVGLESNCVQYGTTNYKPEGLMQQYSMKLRYSAFGYLNDGNELRDGGVMRGRMNYIGPLKPVPGSSSITNSAAEWDAATGVMSANPDPADATATATTAKAQSGYDVTVTNSGVMNYLNKFGQTSLSYKTYDPISELYYAGIRYYKNLGNVASYSSVASAGSVATLKTWLDGFPVITDWGDPILYSCQKNFVLGIGDVNTHRDANLPGGGKLQTDNQSGNHDPATPAEVTADTTVNSVTATNMVGKLEGLSNLGTTYVASGRYDTYFVSGLAYDSHVKDIRADLNGSQTISTYWLDVWENQSYVSKNEIYLATKYGGFTVPDTFSPYASTNGTTTLPQATWHTGTATDKVGNDLRPDNYFAANQADKMVTGLKSAFAKIDKEASVTTSTAFSAAGLRISTIGSASYSSTYDPGSWTGTVTGSTTSFDASGTPSQTVKWNARTLLDAQGSSNRKIVTCCSSAGAAMPFQTTSFAGTTLSARTNYASFGAVPGASSQSAANYLAYLRGDRTKEVANGGAYRTRTYLLGDIVGSKANAVGPPSRSYFDTFNPGYVQFKRDYATRKTVVYAGANDGMLHAFDGTMPGSTACASCGSELFAYIPSFVYGTTATAPTLGLASLGNPDFTHHFLVDATPWSFDVDFHNTDGATGTANDWRTILIGGLGKGGKGYYAIDVTDPASWTSETAVAGKVLWEFTDAHMGYSYGDPSVVKTAKYGWVVILSSGYNNDDGKGYFFIVNPRTGALLETITTADGSTSAPVNLTQYETFVPDHTDFTADALYAGDLRGNVWRVDLTGTAGSYPAPVKIAQLKDADGVAQPVTTYPSIEAVTGSNKRYVLIGTGRLLADTDIASSQTQSLYAIADGTGAAGGFYGGTSTLPAGYTYPLVRANLEKNTSLTTGIGSAPTSPMGWYFDLSVDSGSNVAERVNISPVADNGIVVFAVNLPNGEACSPSGSSRNIAVSLATGKTVLVDSTGALIASTASKAGVITDLSSKSVGGTARFLSGTSLGATDSLQIDPSLLAVLRRLNWRAIPSSD